MNAQQPREDSFVHEIRRQAERLRAGRHLSFWQGLGLVGAVGWMVSIPAVLGALLGRWLDDWFASGVFWTLSLLVTGLTLGCASVWRYIQQELHR